MVLFLFFSRAFASIITLENDPSAIVEGLVNVITGDPVCYEEDLVIQGAEPIHFSRCYANSPKLSKFRSQWHIFGISAQAYKLDSDDWLIIDKNGTPITYTQVKEFDEQYRFEPILREGYSNTSRGKISSQTNLHNNYVLFDKKFKYLTLHSADGTVRKYKKVHKSNGDFRLLSEHLPNGNWILYEYKEDNQIIYLKSIRTTNPKQDKTYASAIIHRTGPYSPLYIEGSDGQFVEYQYEPDSTSITKATSTTSDRTVEYVRYKNIYEKFSNVSALEEHRLEYLRSPGGRFFHFEYYTEDNDFSPVQDQYIGKEFVSDPRRSRVKTISSPYGITHSFFYDLKNRTTTVIDSEGLRTEYRWRKDSRLESIKRFSNQGTLLNGELLTWDSSHLLSYTLIDENEKPISSKSYRYDALGNVTEETLNEFTRHFKYEGLLLIEESSPTGLRICYEYLPGTNLRTAELTYDGDELKLQKHWVYNADNLLIKEVEEDPIVHKTYEYTLLEEGPYIGMPYVIEDSNGKKVFHYTTGGRIEHTEVYDANGEFCFRLTTHYDEKGRPIETINALGESTKSAYDECGNQILIETPRLKTSLTYDLVNNLRAIAKRGDDITTQAVRFNYNTRGQILSETDHRNVITRFEYDVLQRKTATHLGDITLRQRYDAAGNMICNIDGEGYATKTTYRYGKPTLILHPDGACEEFVYNPDGTLQCHIDPLGVKCEYTYDFLGRLIEKSLPYERFDYTGSFLTRKINAEGYETLFSYDSAGRKIREEYGGEITLYTYDSLGRVQTTQKGESILQTEYDLLNRVVKEDLNGRMTTYEYDSVGNQIAITRGATREERAYDALGRLISKKDPPETFEYKDFEIIRTDALGLQTIETLNAFDQVISIEKRNGKTLSLERKTYTKNGQLASWNEIEWKYNARGKPISINDHGRITTYEYTPRNELARTVKPNGVSLSYQYNDLGSCISITSSDDTVHHQMTYDKLDRLIQTDGITRILDSHGRILQETYPSGLWIQNQYDNTGRRIICNTPYFIAEYKYDALDLKQVYFNGKLIHSYEYDDRGNVTQEITLAGPIQNTYDHLSRRTSTNAPNFSQSITAFDPVGNILEMDEAQYTYDPLYQLTSEPGHTYLYDYEYNRLQKDNLVYDFNQEDATYTYDALDRLILINDSQTFTYDSLHRCLSKNNDHFLYDGQNEIGTRTEHRLFGNTPHAEIGASIALILDGTYYTPIHDLQGNIALIIPTSGSPTQFHYTAFGEENTPSLNPWRFSSKRVDPESGLINFGRRFYHPALGRWLTPDPSGYTDGLNLYAYVHNAPLTHYDEYGLIAYDWRHGWVSTPWNSPFGWTPNAEPGDLRIVPSFYPLPKESPHYYVNGILNSRHENYLGAQALQSSMGSHIVPFHSESFGLFKDLRSVHHSRNNDNYTSFATRRLSRELHFQTTSYETLQDPRKLFLTLFSRGAADGYHAIKDLPDNLKQRLIVTACGPAKYIPESFGHIVNNLISDGDWCSKWLNRREIGHHANIRILEQKDKCNWFIQDHFFQSKTYQEGIVDFTRKLYNQYGILR